MNRSNSAADVTASYPTSRGQVFGYVQPNRFYKRGKRTLVYRLPRNGKRLAVSKPLALFLAMLVAAFLTGYVNGGRVPNQRTERIQPTAVVPINTFHRLITISAVNGANDFSINTLSREFVRTESPYQAGQRHRNIYSHAEMTYLYKNALNHQIHGGVT